MTETDKLQTRLDALEAHVAHQDHVIEELSDVAAQQWTEIADLRNRLARLNDKFQEMATGPDGPPGEEPPPPHY